MSDRSPDDPSTGMSTGATPLSRRAAREAAAQRAPSPSATGLATTDSVPTVDSGPLATADSGSAPPSDAVAAEPPTTILDATEEHEPWIFTNSGATAVPYSRNGAAAGEAAQPAARRGEPDVTLEHLFSGQAHTDDLGAPPPPKNKRRRRIGGWIALAVVLVVLAGIAGGGLWVWNTYQPQIRKVMGWEAPKDYAEGLANGEAVITIASGDTGQPISQPLYKAGVTKTPQAFYDYLISSGQNPAFVPGVFKLQKQMTSAAALKAIMDPANKVDNTVVIPEGLAAADALQRIADATGISIDELTAQAADYTQFGVPAEAPSIEGFLFPATYTFDPGVTAHDAIARMINETFSRLDALGVPESERLKTLTLASVIQKESGPVTTDMNKIARVFLNRIDQGMPLQSDATVAYGAGLKGTVWTTEEQRADASNIYNTYAHTGLPPGPISNPGEDAIKAARDPAAGNWLYFVAVNLATGETTFSDTYDEHLKAVRQLQAWCAKSENAPYCK